MRSAPASLAKSIIPSAAEDLLITTSMLALTPAFSSKSFVSLRNSSACFFQRSFILLDISSSTIPKEALSKTCIAVTLAPSLFAKMIEHPKILSLYPDFINSNYSELFVYRSLMVPHSVVELSLFHLFSSSSTSY